MNVIYIWGVGKYIDEVLDCINFAKYEVRGLLDSDSAKIGTLYRDKWPVYSIEDAHTYEYDYIVSSISMINDFNALIAKYNIPSDKFVRYFDDRFESDLFNHDKVKIKILEAENRLLKIRLQNYPYEYNQRAIPKVMTLQETLEDVIHNRKSLCRYGDGEFEMMRDNARPWFQEPHADLNKRLKKCISEKNEKVLIAIANNFGDLENYTEEAADGIREYMTSAVRSEIMSYIDMDYLYGDAYVTRPYIIYRDHSRSDEVFNRFRILWNKRNIIIVEGRYSRLGIGNDLFNTAQSIKRILCPEKNSFDIYDVIKEKVLEVVKEDDLVLISLGPTATVLAYELGTMGIQSIDIGQIDNEYEWYKMNAVKREEIPGKSVAELSWCHTPDNIEDKEYESQIICRLY